jgi:hypothetical protein
MKRREILYDFSVTQDEIEVIETFAITVDHTKFIMIGQKYHYIFEMPSGLCGVLTSSYRSMAEARLPLLYIDGNSASGIIRLLLPARVAGSCMSFLTELGFEPNGIGDYVLKERLSGLRYDIGRTDWSSSFHERNHSYHINVQRAICIGDSFPAPAKTPVKIRNSESVALGKSPVLVIGEAMIAMLTR